jgi:glycosyltransferase involved in cell wall biosynthesis
MLEIVASLFRLFLHPARLTYVFWKAGRKFNAHVYYTNDLDTLLAGVLCSGASRMLIHDAHELWPDQFIGMSVYRSPAIAWMRILERLLIRRANVVITVNEFVAEAMQKRYGIEKPHVVLNLPATEPPKSGLTQRKTGSPKVVLYQGLYTPQRGLENAIRACEFLENDVVLVLRGSGPTEQQLRAIAKPYRNCSFDPPVNMSETVTAAAQTADVGLVSYLPVNINNYFASPNKLFEYIQAGLPVVSSDLPFLRSIIAGNEIGLLFDPRDPTDIAAKMNMATRNDVLASLRTNVRRIQKRYSWDEEQQKLVSLVRRLTW